MAGGARPGARRRRRRCSSSPTSSTTGSAAAARPSTRTRRRPSASTRAPAAGRPTCSSASTSRRGSCRRSSRPARPSARSPPTSPSDGIACADGRRGRRRTTRLGGGCGSAPWPRLGVHQRRHVVARRRGADEPADRRRVVRRQPDERGRRRRHRSTAAERHRAVAAPRVSAGLGARGQRALRSTSWSRSPSRLRRFARSSIPTMPHSLRPATCRRGSASPARRTGQPEPARPGRGRALHPREPRAEARAGRSARWREVTGREPAELHIVGGGARNELLCDWTAEAAGLPVLAGPEEATLFGNLLVQAMALGEISSLAEAREVVKRSVTPTTYEPADTPEWREAPRAVRADHRGPIRAGGERVSEVVGRPPRHLRARGPLGRVERGRARRARRASSTARTCSAPTAPLPTRAVATRRPRRRSSITLGRETRVLWVKGSGTDLATIAPAGFAGLRLDELLPLRARDAMDDAEMVDYLRRCALSPDQPRPSIETLLHAFIPAAHVDHTHPDAVIALTSTPDGRRLAEETFGEEAVWLDYQRPGFDMSRRIARAPATRSRQPARCLLERHGLVTWGETSEDSYRATLEFVTRAAEALARAAGGRFGLGGGKVAELREESAVALLARSLPALRGALLADADGVDPRGRPQPRGGRLRFVRSVLPKVSQIGAPCPDHLIHTKHKPLVVEFDPETGGADELSEAFKRGVAEYSRWYRDYYERNVTTRAVRSLSTPPAPGSSSSRASASSPPGAMPAERANTRDLYHRAIAVQNAAEALGGFRSLSESEAFAIEYWPLERYKLAQAPLARRARRPGRADHRRRQRHRPRDSAHACRAAARTSSSPTSTSRAPEVSPTSSCPHTALRRALAVSVDVTSEEAVEEMVRRAVLEFGGLDILVASAGLASSSPITETTLADWERHYAVLARGYFLPAREAFSVLVEQGCGGSIVFVASKNALVAGANASAYSSAKAASLHLARCLAEEGGQHGIRVNTVNPDAVIEGSALWSSDWKAERASTYGVSEDDLPALLPRAHDARRQRLSRRTWPRRSPTSPGPAARSRPATSSTSTAASPPPTRDEHRPQAAARRAARADEELRRRAGAHRRRSSSSTRAPCTRSSARTARASRRSSRS